MPKRATQEDYISSVVAVHDLKNRFHIPQSEAKTDEDALIVLWEAGDVVAAAPSIQMAYTGVLRATDPEDQRKAITKVRGIEREIDRRLHDKKLLTDKKFETSAAKLKTDEEVIRRAEFFAKLFKKVLPRDLLPERGAAKEPVQAPAPKERLPRKPRAIPEKIPQASRFTVVERDDAVEVNDILLELSKPQLIMLRALIAESNAQSGLYLTPAVIKHSARWRTDVSPDLTESHKIFTASMLDMQAKLTALGLRNLIESKDSRYQIAYRLKPNSIRHYDRPDQIVDVARVAVASASAERGDAEPATKEQGDWISTDTAVAVATFKLLAPNDVMQWMSLNKIVNRSELTGAVPEDKIRQGLRRLVNAKYLELTAGTRNHPQPGVRFANPDIRALWRSAPKEVLDEIRGYIAESLGSENE